MKLYITRHGETKRNKEQRVLGRTDDPLSEKGLAQAAELAEKMKDIEIRELFRNTDAYADKEVKVYGTFAINSYLVTFKIDDKVFYSESLPYGAEITAPEAPEKEGHTFTGWGEVDATVPAHDVTYWGTYTVNTYCIYYYVGEELVNTIELFYGETIPEYIYEPTTEGDVFMGWIGDTYDTMPAHDVTYTANIANGIENSEINTLNSEFIYDLSGRKVTDMENLRGGIYIVNGKKTVIK